jgi:hypothetical protein
MDWVIPCMNPIDFKWHTFMYLTQDMIALTNLDRNGFIKALHSSYGVYYFTCISKSVQYDVFVVVHLLERTTSFLRAESFQFEY